MTLDELMSLVAMSDPDPYFYDIGINDSRFYFASRTYMPMLIEVAKAVQADSFDLDGLPGIRRALEALEKEFADDTGSY